MISGRLSNRPSTTFKKLLVLVFVVFISLVHYLNEKRTFTIFADELFVFSGIQFTGTQGAERDLGTHLS
jgi:hypothetical protein